MAVVLAGRFAVERKIGEGTFAEVWRAHDRQSPAADAPVALKIFHPLPEGTASDDAWDPLYREVAAGLAMAPHPNVVRSWAMFETDFLPGARTPCLVMDYVEGINLALWLAEQPPPGPAAVAPRLAVMSGLLAGLAHAHGGGVAHQDISFGNVLVREGDPPDALLTDFGCAQAPGYEPAASGSDEFSVPLQPINPPPYALDRPLAESTRRDLYAFATLAYLALIGRHPLTDEWQTLRAGQWSGPPAPHAILPRRPMTELAPWTRDVPGLPAISDMLLRCLAADPLLRPDSAAALWPEWEETARAVKSAR